MDENWTPTLEDTPFTRIGDEEGVRRLVEHFYDAMSEHEPALARLHSCDADGRVDRSSRDHFALFLCFWLGGPKDYLTVRGHPRLRMRHGHLPVDVGMRDAWLRSMERAMDACEVRGGLRRHLGKRFAEVADFLRNVPD
ncbi:MAG: cyanoglobin [Myxococcaceae bacterium]|nr:cyanoglobin [Myxococcaceae bacterium]MCI0669102.1 cyanoglobin [Myxococcaceae bacterium]